MRQSFENQTYDGKNFLSKIKCSFKEMRWGCFCEISKGCLEYIKTWPNLSLHEFPKEFVFFCERLYFSICTGNCWRFQTLWSLQPKEWNLQHYLHKKALRQLRSSTHIDSVFSVRFLLIREFWWESVCKLWLTRNRKFDLISQSGWITQVIFFMH